MATLGKTVPWINNSPPAHRAARICYFQDLFCLCYISLFVYIGAFVGCYQLPHTTRTVPNVVANGYLAYTISRPPLIIHTFAPVDLHDPVIEELGTLRHRIEATLGVPSRYRLIHVHVFPDRSEFEKACELVLGQPTARRGFFAEYGNQLCVFTYLHPEVKEDLRHEVTHAYLHAALESIPVWLDEGLAEYFETAPEHAGLHGDHLQLLRAMLVRGWSPDMARLERIPASAAMTAEDYAESWAWAYFLLSTNGPEKRIFRTYLMALSEGKSQPPLSKRLTAVGQNVNEKLAAMLRQFPVDLSVAHDASK